MKSILLTVLLVASAGPAFAGSPVLSAPALSSRFTCEGQALSRIAMRAEPAPCCVGMFGCPQLLANTGMIKPKRTNRT